MEAYGKTDVGIARTLNQDCIYYTTSPVGLLQNLFVVADGMGGHAAGDFASRYTVENLVHLLEHSTSKHLVSAIDDSIHLVNKMLVRQADENLDMYGMGTTLVLATIENNILYVANVGDSRLYVIGDDICQITRDHSYVEEMVSAGKIERGSSEYYSRKNVITRAIGSPSGVVVDYFEIELRENTQILLCSDGLTNMLTDEEILQILRSTISSQKKVDALIDAANKNGGTDNISAVLVIP
jgi:protein phosphatase